MRRCSRDEVLCKRQQIDKFSHLFILASLNLVFDWACVVYSRMSNEAKMMTTSNSAPENGSALHQKFVGINHSVTNAKESHRICRLVMCLLENIYVFYAESEKSTRSHRGWPQMPD
jgi:hypothetical protein